MYRAISFNSDARVHDESPLSDYTVRLANPVRKVTEIRLGEIDLPKTSQYTVEQGLDRRRRPLNKNTLSFTENFRIAKNGVRYNGTEVHVPNHTTRAVRFASVLDDEVHFFSTNVQWSVDEYATWRGAANAPLELLGHGDARAMTVRKMTAADVASLTGLDKQRYDFLNAPGTYYFYTVTNVGNLGLVSIDTVNNYRRYYFHRAPWGIPNLISFINHAMGRAILQLTANGEFRKLVPDAIEYLDADVFNAMDGATTGTFDLANLPLKIEGDKTTASMVAPKLRATLPVGDYAPGDVAKYLPLHMNLCLLRSPTALKVNGADVVVPAGHYPAPFLLQEALQRALEGTGVAVKYEGETQKRTFEEAQKGLKQFVFTAAERFTLDLRDVSEELALALSADRVLFGPSQRIALRPIVWPNFLADQFSSLVYSVGGVSPEQHKFCIKAESYPATTVDATVESFDTTVVSRTGEVWLTDMTAVLPLQVNDVVRVAYDDGYTSTGKVVAYGTRFTLTIDGDALDDQNRYIVKQERAGDSSNVEGIVYGIVGNTLDVFSMHNTDNNAFEAGAALKVYRFVDFNVVTVIELIATVTLTNVVDTGKVGCVLFVGDDTPNVEKETKSVTIAPIDAPRFEIEPLRNSISARLGVGTQRLSGDRNYLLPNRWNLSAVPYVLMYLDVGGSIASQQILNRHLTQRDDGTEEESLYFAKLTTNTQFTVNRHETMEFKFTSPTDVGQFKVRFENADGSLVEFHGARHAMTLALISNAK